MPAGTINCRCGAVNYPLEDSLPGDTELCHCNPCRHTTGALFLGFVNLRNSKPDPSVLEKCTAYASSKTHNRWFCSICGTPLFVETHHKPDGSVLGSWACLGGAIDPPQGSTGNSTVLNVETNEWLADTGGDGGMAPLFTKLGGREIACYDTYPNSKKYTRSDLDEMVKAAAAIQAPGVDDMLRAECRCGGVSLQIRRANHEDKSFSKLDEFIPRDSNGKPQNEKYCACACVCRDCRLHTGSSLTQWAYIPPARIINPHTNEPVAQHRDAIGEPAANEGLKLRQYWSSPDACRAFCFVCGASVFYTFDDRSEIINIAGGLLRPEEGGIMARQGLSWDRAEISFENRATDRHILAAWKVTAETATGSQ